MPIKNPQQAQTKTNKKINTKMLATAPTTKTIESYWLILKQSAKAAIQQKIILSFILRPFQKVFFLL